MAKDLPYFKFSVSEWNDGDITLCSLEAQGLFINLCSLYWSQEGNLSITKCKRRFKDCNTTVWDELTTEQIIKVDGDQISISFLDEQFQERVKLSTINKQNIEKRWKKAIKTEPDTVVLPPNNDGKQLEYNIEERRGEESKGEESRVEEIREEQFSDLWFENIFDDIQMESIRSVFREHDIQNEFLIFKLKVRGARGDYINRDSNGIKQAFIYQLKNSKPNVNRSTNKGKSTGADAILERPKDWGSFD